MPREIPVTSARRKVPDRMAAKDRAGRSHTKGFKGASTGDPVKAFGRSAKPRTVTRSLMGR